MLPLALPFKGKEKNKAINLYLVNSDLESQQTTLHSRVPYVQSNSQNNIPLLRARLGRLWSDCCTIITVMQFYIDDLPSCRESGFKNVVIY